MDADAAVAPTAGQTVATTVQVDFALAIGSGRLDVSVDVPTLPVTLTQLLPVLQNVSSSVIGSIANAV